VGRDGEPGDASEAIGGHLRGDPLLGRYARLKRVGELLFVAGVSARRPDDTVPGVARDADGTLRLDVRVQTEGCFENLAALLAGVGGGLGDVVDVTCFLLDMRDYRGFVEVWNRHFDASGPTRTTVAVHQLPDPQLAVELKAIAKAPGS
jgi:2-aminomuconate deaminase